MTATPSPAKPEPASTTVFAEERAILLPDAAAADAPLAALCLSGGGIRSATFALGVLQALARFDLLQEFHYLSTVSGGGYIGSWLTAWRIRARDDAKVFAALDRTRHPDGAEAAEVVGLRANSNYLTPKLGMLSADTWAALALVVRNLVLNWCVFGPLFLAVLLLPKLATSALTLIQNPAWRAWGPWLIVAGFILLAAGLSSAVRGRLQAEQRWLTDGNFLGRVLVPLIAAAVAFTIAADTLPTIALADALLLGVCGGGLSYVVGWVIGYRWWQASVADPQAERVRSVVRLSDVLCFAVAGGFAGALLATGLHLRASLSLTPNAIVVLGPAWAMAAFALADLVFVGLNSFAERGDQDREWLARYGGWLMAAAVTFLVTCAVDLFLPGLLNWGWRTVTAYLTSLGVSGAITLLLGPSKLTGATMAGKAREPVKISTLVSVAALLFALCLAGALSLVDDRLTYLLSGSDATPLRGQSWLSIIPPSSVFEIQLLGLVALAVVLAITSTFINVNRFSLHALYRNRLIRAYLGSARAGDRSPRRPDPFSGFDPADNLPLHRTLPPANGTGNRLLHVINMTLNVVSTDRLAWQERKAEPFSATALHTGNDIVGYKPKNVYGSPNGGLSLGTAMAISGAAVSPNMGYHSSPLVGMLLSLFNVRLGWWLGNPAKGCFGKEGPVPSLIPALNELAGRTTDTDRWIYLSDGGHFENLGLYEMVKRRCRSIVVSDAGCDPDCSFEDLGNAVKKIYIDLGVSIEFHPLGIAPRKDPPTQGFYCAVGTVKYPGQDQLGWLLYIKPGYQGAEPAHVRSYAIANPTFPHETTADQWFTESQFEAYRALGAYITEMICTGGTGVAPGQTPQSIGLKDVMKQAARYLTQQST
jgi:hypothetical protein